MTLPAVMCNIDEIYIDAGFDGVLFPDSGVVLDATTTNVTHAMSMRLLSHHVNMVTDVIVEIIIVTRNFRANFRMIGVTDVESVFDIQIPREINIYTSASRTGYSITGSYYDAVANYIKTIPNWDVFTWTVLNNHQCHQ